MSLAKSKTTQSVNLREKIREILTKYNFEKVRETSNGFTCCCKFHDDKSPSFSINENGLWICFACGKKGNFKTLLKELGENVSNWEQDVNFILSISEYKEEEKKSKSKSKENEQSLYGLPIPPKFRCFRDFPNEIPEYLLKRLELKTIFTFLLGKSSYYCLRNRIIIPVMENWKPVGYMARAIEDDMHPKYLNSPGVDLKNYLFNYDRCEKNADIIILEGAFNLMSMYEKGFKNLIATMGVKITEKQFEKIVKLKPKTITICFDRDENQVGQKAATELADTLVEFFDVYIMPLPKGKDPNELSKEVLEVCYAKRFKYTKKSKQ